MRIFILSLALLLPGISHASIFDSADFLPANGTTLGAFGELILNNPAGEGIEARARHGWTDDLNVGAIFGTGSKNRKFRFGGEASYNFIPDYDGQFGLTALATAMYLRRENSGGIQIRVAPLVHKKVDGWNKLPVTLYLSLPYYFEARSGSFTTAMQLVFGSIFDINEKGQSYIVGEGGLQLNRSESYVLLGGGFRFGEIKLRKKFRDSGDESDKDREYKSEDFQ
jgi:hypothetical protein